MGASRRFGVSPVKFPHKGAFVKICLIAKYPPIQGGESSKTYWMAKGLGCRGCEVHIVTNAWEVEDDYREGITTDDLDGYYQPKNVIVHNTDPFSDPSYIPYAKPYTEKLAGLAIDVTQQFQLEIIDTWYLLPYAVAGFMASTLTERPQIVRHAGSDITRLFESPFMNSLFLGILRRAQRIVTHSSHRQFFNDLEIDDSAIHLNRLLSVDTSAFSPEVAPIGLREMLGPTFNGEPVITYAGKIGTTKGVFDLIEAFSQVRTEARLLFICGGPGTGRLREAIANRGLTNRVAIHGFVPPWKMPALLKASACIVVPERDFPVVHHTPILPREVLATGGCLILSTEIFGKLRALGIEKDKHALVVDPKNIPEFSAALETAISCNTVRRQFGAEARALSLSIERFDGYIEDMMELYRGCQAVSV